MAATEAVDGAGQSDCAADMAVRAAPCRHRDLARKRYADFGPFLSILSTHSTPPRQWLGPVREYLAHDLRHRAALAGNGLLWARRTTASAAIMRGRGWRG